ncbi:hypothetical protein DMUE_4473 [Dictyocoela muelleri]|nr:hypothetical protein DMUE_4473 [Dictyocoela muelleri]
MAFSFFPPNEIPKNVLLYEEYLNNNNKSDKRNIFKIWNWLKEPYLKNDFKKPINVFFKNFEGPIQAFLSDCPLTTNAIEGWHRSLNFNIRIPHPSITILVEELIKEQNKVEFEIIKLLHNRYTVTNNLNNESRFRKIILDYDKFYDLGFIKYIASLFEIKTNRSFFNIFYFLKFYLKNLFF